MNLELKAILDNIVAELKEQGHDPMVRPIVFIWSYPNEELKYTLVIEKKTEDDDKTEEVVH